jgi:prepilin-type N-terminal cleavage/methylation domain-containing protein
VRRSIKAFTLLELLAVVVVIVIAAMMIPAMLGIRAKASRVYCANNLKNVGLAYRIFATDSNDRFPFEISTNAGGTLELRSNIVAQFMVLSNELATPFTIICPERNPPIVPARDFSHLSNSNIGFFINLSAIQTHTNWLLSGDSGFELQQTSSPLPQSTIITNPSFRFPEKFHRDGRPPGYVIADGSVNFFGKRAWSDHQANFQATNEILVP